MTKGLIRHEPTLVERLLDVPHLERVIPQLQPEALHRVIEKCGLEACGEIVALASPAQLSHIFDLDLWHADRPGREETFDADRFGVWLEVLVEIGAEEAAKTIARVDTHLVVAALSQYILVLDPATVMPAVTADGDEVPDVPKESDDGPVSRVGGYLIVHKRADSMDAILAVLSSLETSNPDYLDAVMHGCRSLSNSRPEIDGLDDLLMDPEQALLDLAIDRENRREQRGYVTPEQAHAFLEMSRELPRGKGTTLPANPVARAYFRALEWETTPTDGAHETGSSEDADAVAAVADLLLEAGVVSEQPRALLAGAEGPAPRLARIQAFMRVAGERDRIAFLKRTEELAYLTNTVAAGCSIGARTFTVLEASDAAVAVCNLGLENWPVHWLASKTRTLPDDFLVAQDLVTVFQVGWAVLYSEACMGTATGLVAALKRVRCEDRDIQTELNALRIEMTKQIKAGEPWLAREALDVIEALDMPAWAALRGLIAEYPVMHAALSAAKSGKLSVDPAAFEFISENAQIEAIREFIVALPATLG